jgi:hypothetical protein
VKRATDERRQTPSNQSDALYVRFDLLDLMIPVVRSFAGFLAPSVSLTSNIGVRCVVLGIERVEVLFESLVSGNPWVDNASAVPQNLDVLARTDERPVPSEN